MERQVYYLNIKYKIEKAYRTSNSIKPLHLYLEPR